jgi:hypothetical protein
MVRFRLPEPFMLRSRALVLLLVMFLAGAVLAQTCSRNIIANAIGANGFPVTDLATADFKVLHPGQPLRIMASGFRSDPSVRIVILLDTSASMAMDGGKYSVKWKIARDAALDLVSTAPPQARVSLMTFTTSVGRRFNTADGREPIENWLKSDAVLKASEVRGMTALYATIGGAIKEMKPAHSGDAIYAITDGGDTEGKESLSHVIRELQSNGIRLFAFLLNDSLGNSRSARELYDLAKASGGLTFIVNPYSAGTGWAGSGFARRYEYDEKKVSAVQADAKWVLAAMTNFYILTVGVEGSTKPEEWNLEIIDQRGEKRKDLTLTYPQRLEGCIVDSAVR